jgi:hypothetical protein
VQFYFNALISGLHCTLALVLLYSQPDADLLQESSWTVWSMKVLGNEGLQVVDAKSIISVVLIQPHDHRLEDRDAWFFVWEQMGLKMALLSGSLDPIPGLTGE